jgi:hypothetical protein
VFIRGCYCVYPWVFAVVIWRRGEFEDFGAHFLAGLEFHHRARGDRHVGLRLVWIAADAGLADFHIEHAEVAQLHLVALGERLGDVVQSFLHDIKNLGLDQPGFLTDAHHKIAFGQGHSFCFVLMIDSDD